MKIDFLEFGGGKETLIFLHGWQQDKKSFFPLVPYLFQNFHLYLLDLPGFGKSKPPAFISSSLNYAKIISQWLEEKNLTKVTLIGHSFGGKIASVIAAENPKIIRKLILIANSGIPHPKKWYPLFKIIPKPAKTAFSPLVKRLFASRDYKEAGSLLPIFKTIVKEDLTLVFSKIKVKTLIIWGKNDSESPLQDGIKINKLILNSRLVIVNGGHFCFREDPKKISQIISDFIKSDFMKK